MQATSAYIKPVLWGAFAGAIAMAFVGFWALGWTTQTNAERIATDRANTAVIAALAPFCVANANKVTETAKLAAFRAEASSYKRTQLVSDAGWSSMPGTTSPNYALASACSEMLKGEKTS